MIKDLETVVKEKYENASIEYNLHSHNYLCGHAKGSVSDYCIEAINKGLKLIGISDHGRAPVDNKEHYITLKEFYDSYLPQFDEAEKLYKDKIIIKKGLEIEYFKGYDNLYKEYKDNLDYLILGQHFFKWSEGIDFVFKEQNNLKKAIDYYDQLLDGINSGYFKIVAHPDVMIGRYQGDNKELIKEKLEECIKACIKNDVYVEVNVNGFRSNGFTYPTDELIEICKKLNAKVVIGSDNHTPQALVDDYTKKIVTYLKIKELNVLELKDIKI